MQSLTSTSCGGRNGAPQALLRTIRCSSQHQFKPPLASVTSWGYSDDLFKLGMTHTHTHTSKLTLAKLTETV